MPSSAAPKAMPRSRNTSSVIFHSPSPSQSHAHASRGSDQGIAAPVREEGAALERARLAPRASPRPATVAEQVCADVRDHLGRRAPRRLGVDVGDALRGSCGRSPSRRVALSKLPSSPRRTIGAGASRRPPVASAHLRDPRPALHVSDAARPRPSGRRARAAVDRQRLHLAGPVQLARIEPAERERTVRATSSVDTPESAAFS